MQQGEAFLTTRGERETEYIGQMLGRLMQNPLVVALKGDLGTGKTVLVRGAAKGLGVREPVTSPTFVLLKIYQGRLPVYHFDFYRLQESGDLDNLGFEEYLPGDGAAFVEWADRVDDVLPAERLEIVLERLAGEQDDVRRLWLLPFGKEAMRLVERIIEGVAWHVDGRLNMSSAAGEQGGSLC